MSRLPHFLGSWLKADGEVVSFMHQLPFTPPSQRFLVLIICVRHCVEPRAIVQLEGLCQLKNPVTSLGFKPMTFYDFNINVLSLLLATTGRFLVCCVHRKGVRNISYVKKKGH
jgi:hypothetical protein